VLATLPPSVSRLCRQCVILNISQPYRPPRPVTGIALLYLTNIVGELRKLQFPVCANVSIFPVPYILISRDSLCGFVRMILVAVISASFSLDTSQ
jgi:hypothetical protein